jgi:hypothetical protein
MESGAIFKEILDDPQFQTTVMEHYLTKVFSEARSAQP